MAKTVEEHIAAAQAHLDQLIEQQRTTFADPELAGMTHGQCIAAMVGAMAMEPPETLDEILSLGAVAVLAVDRLTRLPRPQIED